MPSYTKTDPKRTDNIWAQSNRVSDCPPPGPVYWSIDSEYGDITPERVQKIFVLMRQHNVSRRSLARYFCIGEHAIEEYLTRSNAIPKHVGEKMLRFLRQKTPPHNDITGYLNWECWKR